MIGWPSSGLFVQAWLKIPLSLLLNWNADRWKWVWEWKLRTVSTKRCNLEWSNWILDKWIICGRSKKRIFLRYFSRITAGKIMDPGLTWMISLWLRRRVTQCYAKQQCWQSPIIIAVKNWWTRYWSWSTPKFKAESDRDLETDTNGM